MPFSDMFSNINIETLGEYFIDGANNISKAISNIFDGSAEYNDTSTFKALVLTNPQIISPTEATAMGYDFQNSPADQVIQKFKVRIISSKINPHRILADPCDPSTIGSEERCMGNALLSAHTTIVTKERKGLAVGSIIEIRLDKLRNGDFNLQSGHYINMLSNNTSGGSTTLTAEHCENIEKVYEDGTPYEPPPPLEISSDIRELAKDYDNINMVPNKSQHREFLYGDNPPALAKPFDMFFKAFIQRVYEELGIQIHITSGFRTIGQQEELRRKYLARKAANPNDPTKWGLPAACGTCSRHISGAAIDLNLIMPDGKWITSKTLPKKTSWEQTGVVGIANEMGFVWGGTFSKYDPVHFEYQPVEWGNRSTIDEIFEQGHTRYDTVNTGMTREEEKERIKESESNEDDYYSGDEDVSAALDNYIDSSGNYGQSPTDLPTSDTDVSELASDE